MPLTLDNRLYTVSQLNRESKRVLNEHFFSVRVAGEISNLSTPSSGHIYFSLKDNAAQIRCAMFKTQLRRLKFKPANGLQVIATAQVTLYEPRGDYQLVVENLEGTGDGALRMAFEALKDQLSKEGLFDASRKKPLPTLPHCIGIITSPSGAAIRDILTVLKRRFPAIPVILYPVSVQGDNAKHDIVRALNLANTLDQCDVLILGRGGGSLEDLQAFNEEIVARAIAASAIPVIAGVGHEIDVTIADFVADLRAATPSAAAEHAVPDQREWQSRFISLETKLSRHLDRQLAQKGQTLAWLDKRLKQQHPGQKLAANAQRLDELELRLTRATRRKLLQCRSNLDTQSAKLHNQSPARTINSLALRQHYLQQRLNTAWQRKFEHLHQQLNQAGQTLHAVSPLATLNRGYALVTDTETGTVIRSTRQIEKDAVVLTRLANGRFTSRVETITED
ncbi:MAG: exodeoxyribonuclease VII large subunit [Methylomicrobium sp.]|nr:exodeoxyribonuclease VII large subunit [Methylomicrobium sp.]